MRHGLFIRFPEMLERPHMSGLSPGSTPAADVQLIYFKRYRMERALGQLPPVPELPDGHIWMPWSVGLLDTHAHVKALSFHHEIDSLVFPSLGHYPGCLDLMRAITSQRGFCPEATWLIANKSGFCATVQGVRESHGIGMIQNLGVMSGSRGLRLGGTLLLQALHGFRRAGLRGCILEVTARNSAAVRLYRNLGFRCAKTFYRAVSVQMPVPFELPPELLSLPS